MHLVAKVQTACMTPAGGGPCTAAVPGRGFPRFPQVSLPGLANNARPIRIYYPPQSAMVLKTG